MGIWRIGAFRLFKSWTKMKADITKVKDAVAIRASERPFVRGVLLTEMYILEQQS